MTLGVDRGGSIQPVRVSAPQRMSRWMPVPIGGKKWSPFRQFHLFGEVYAAGDLVGTTSTEPVLFTDGRYVVTISGDDYLLEDHSSFWTPPKGFSADEPFGSSRFHGPYRLGKYAHFVWRSQRSWHLPNHLMRGLRPPVRLIDWTVIDSSVGIVITGIVTGSRDYAPNTRVKIIPHYTSGRFVKAASGREYVLYEPALEYRVANRGYDPLRPLLGLE